MQALLFITVLIPIIIFALIIFLGNNSERKISTLTNLSGYGTLALVIFNFTQWVIGKGENIFQHMCTLYTSSEFDFRIEFLFDKYAAVYSAIGAFLFIMVAKFSKTYMHRDEGFKRYFTVLNLFFVGFLITVLAGNFETMFIGWEVLGICSFLLISFYRDRYLPAKNALKVVSLYRLGDVCLILALWICHHLFHKNISFHELPTLLEGMAPSGSLYFLLTMLLIAALIKSALFPFSSWLPRAMEGPTTSSAIFYGSLSVHIGLFLLMRSYALWQEVWWFKIVLILFGLLTIVSSNSIARVQSTVKTQVGYASITQIGIMIIEVALGLHILALVHFALNAVYRTYQLLISPSVMNYQIHDMFFHFKKTDKVYSKFEKSMYLFNIKEWGFDAWQYTYLWQPFKKIGTALNKLSYTASIILGVGLLAAGIYYTSIEHTVDPQIDSIITYVISAAGLIFILKGFASRTSALATWAMLVLGQCFVTLSVFINEHVPMHQVWIYLSGICLAAIIGFWAISVIKTVDGDIKLDKWHSYHQDKPTSSLMLLLACLAILGFPFTPTFLGLDLLFTHIHSDQYALVFITALSFIFIELAALRLYARLCMGLHKKNDRVKAWRSS
jgi:NADH-quinone oxidoreductase subunit L